MAHLCGWSQFRGPERRSTAPRRRRAVTCFPHTRYSTGVTHGCRFYRFATRRSHRVPRWWKPNPQVRPCFFMKFGYNHSSDCFKVMDADMGMVMYSRDMTWHQPCKPLTFPVSTLGARSSNPSFGIETSGYVYLPLHLSQLPCPPPLLHSL